MNRKFKSALLCSAFAMMALTGCDKVGLGGNQNQRQDVAVTQTVQPQQTEEIKTAPVAPVAQPAPVEAVKKEVQPDERTFSNGERVGHITKFSFKSSPQRLDGDDLELCKNWEGELSMENTVANNAVDAKGATNGSNAFSFSIGKGRNDIVKKIQTQMRNGHRVSLQYNQVVRHDECKSRTDYYVVGVKDLEPPAPKPPAPIIIQQAPVTAPAPSGR